MAQQAYTATSVVLTDANTNYNLMGLVIDPANGNRPNAPQACRELTIQVDPGAGNDDAVVVSVGDGAMEADKVGYKLAKGESTTYRSDNSDRVYPGSMVVRATVAATVLNVEIVKG
jgi:hypothetical protein